MKAFELHALIDAARESGAPEEARLYFEAARTDLEAGGVGDIRRSMLLVGLCEWLMAARKALGPEARGLLMDRIQVHLQAPRIHHPQELLVLRLAALHAGGDGGAIDEAVRDLFVRCREQGVLRGRHRWELARHRRWCAFAGRTQDAEKCGRLLHEAGEETEEIPRLAGAWVNPVHFEVLLDCFRKAEGHPGTFSKLHGALEWQMMRAGRRDVLEWIDRWE